MNTNDRSKTNAICQPDCHCKRCTTNNDNARWERIFKEKFADPLYYNRNQVRNASPITDM
jgi:hypothetical protein